MSAYILILDGGYYNSPFPSSFIFNVILAIFPRASAQQFTTSCEQERLRLLQLRICRRWKRLLRPPRQRVARACEKNRHTPAAS